MSQAKAPWTCPKCKVENDPDFTHCRICGDLSPLLEGKEKTCPNCNAKGGAGHTCCPVCGSAYFAQH